jgi:hypothetical protein
MVEFEWRVSLVRFKVHFLCSSVSNCWMINLRLGGALRGKRRIVSWEGRGV